MVGHTASPEMEDKTTQPSPETLQPQSDDETVVSAAPTTKGEVPKRLKRVTYRPSHKATFIGLAVVVVILAVNVGVIAWLMRGNGVNAVAERNEVTLSSETLDKLGVSKNAVGTRGTELVVGPNARFNGKVIVGGDITVAGKLSLNSTFVAPAATIAKLEAGETSLSKLAVNGDSTLSNLNVGRDMTVIGATRLQGPVTITQLLTVNNNLNVAGNLAVGGTLSARGFQASSLTSDTTLTIGGHIITRGSAPNVGPGGTALGSNGTVSISGNDAAGTVAANVGVGATSGIVANIAFRNAYGSTPHVIVTAVGSGPRNVYVTRSPSGFSIGVGDAMPPGGWAFDYIVMQ